MTIWTATTKAFTAIQAAFNAVMALNPIFLIVAAVVAIIAILVVLQKEFGLFDGVIRVVGDAFAAVWAAIKTVFDWVKDNWQLLLVILTGPFGLALAFVITFKDQIIGFIKGVIDWVTNNWKLILAILTGPFGLAILAITTFKDQIINVFSIIYNGIKATMGFIADVITAPFKAAFKAVAGLWNNTVGKLSFTVPGWVPGIGGKGFDVPDIPMLENGGIVTKATLAMIGEGNEPEAVIPLSKLGSMGFGGGGGNTFNVTVTSADPNAVVAALQRYVRMSGPVPVTTRPL
jgi:SLT domain-containing protein